MSNELKKKRKGASKACKLVLLAIFFFIAFPLADAPPQQPQNIEGRVLTDGNNGVQAGIPVLVNNTANSDNVIVYTEDPGPEPLRGIYSATVQGNTNDLVTVIAWNSTHYGNATANLGPSTNKVDIVLDTARQSEANVTIISPSNHTLKNKSIAFNVTANITMMGGNGVDCNAVINFSNQQVVNITSNENAVHPLGNIQLGASKSANWSVIGLSEGSSNITVSAACSSDGIKLENMNSKTISNATIANSIPFINSISANPVIDLAAGGSTGVSCNISLSEGNTISDIKSINATFYMAAAGNSAPDDNNNHYTNSSCAMTGSSVFEANYSCGFKVAYYGNSGLWKCNATAADYSNAESSRNISSFVGELLAIDISTAVIDYGNLKATNVSGVGTVVIIRNHGNIPMNVTARAFAPSEVFSYLNLSMACASSNISNANQRFSIGNDAGFPSMAKLDNETFFIGLSLDQRTDDLAAGNDTNSTFWKLEVPPLVSGLCSGTIIFGAVPR